MQIWRLETFTQGLEQMLSDHLTELGRVSTNDHSNEHYEALRSSRLVSYERTLQEHRSFSEAVKILAESNLDPKYLMTYGFQTVAVMVEEASSRARDLHKVMKVVANKSLTADSAMSSMPGAWRELGADTVFQLSNPRMPVELMWSNHPNVLLSHEQTTGGPSRGLPKEMYRTMWFATVTWTMSGAGQARPMFFISERQFAPNSGKPPPQMLRPYAPATAPPTMYQACPPQPRNPLTPDQASQVAAFFQHVAPTSHPRPQHYPGPAWQG